MARFFIAASNITGGVAYLGGQDLEHIRVLRLKKGETFTICDGNGTDYLCRLSDAKGDGTCAEVLETHQSEGEPTVQCTVFAAYSKGDKMDTVVQKCVELGASSVIAYPSRRCVSTPDALSAQRKAVRWQKIAQEAAKQCGRGMIPQISAASSFESAVGSACRAELPLFLYESEREHSFRSAMEKASEFRTFSVFTGPEGGFDPAEAEYAAEHGMLSVSLGPRILRCETAPICALTAVMLMTGNL